MFVIIICDIGFYGIGIIAGGGHRDYFRVIAIPDFPVRIRLHGFHEVFGTDNQNVTFFSYRCAAAAQGSVIQELIGINGIKSAVVLGGGSNRSRTVECHLDRHGRVNLQFLCNRVIVERINLETHSLKVAKLIVFTRLYRIA